MIQLLTPDDLKSVFDRLDGAEARLASLEGRKPQIQGFTLWNFPADVGAPKLDSMTETSIGFTFTTSTHTAPQVDDTPFSRPDRMALDLVTLGKGSVDFMLYAWSAEQAVNSAQFASTPTMALVKTVTMATDIDQHRYHKYFSLAQSEIDALMAIPTKYGLNFALRYKAQAGCLMSSLMASVFVAYR